MRAPGDSGPVGPKFEVGKTYEHVSEFDTDPNNGRRAIALKLGGGNWWTIRWANGHETVVDGRRLRGPIEPLRPGEDEPCAVCDRSGRIKILEPVSPDKPWQLKPVGEKDCPNCSPAGPKPQSNRKPPS